MKLTKEMGRRNYIFQAALEYLVAIVVGGSYLATLTSYLGISDSVTGIITSFVSLGCLFQFFSLFLQLKKQKTFVVILSTLNQLLFALLYVVPISGLSSGVKATVFIVTIFSAYIIYNVAHPKKINWLMTMVDDNTRGKFTANKQIFSLAAGMGYSLLMGTIMDHYTNSGQHTTAFIIAGTVILVLMLLHLLTLIFSPDVETSDSGEKRSLKSVLSILKDKKVMRVAGAFILYQIAHCVATPFYASYSIGELGLSLKYISILTIFSSFVRIFAERPFGRYADRKSFAKMTEKSFLLLAVAYGVMIFAVPSNGMVLKVFYYVFHSIMSAGMSSSFINLVFEEVEAHKRADALAVTQSLSGFMGFLTTLAVSPLVSFVQGNQNQIFGFTIYAQQILSVIGAVLALLAALYVRRVLINKKNKEAISNK